MSFMHKITRIISKKKVLSRLDHCAVLLAAELSHRLRKGTNLPVFLYTDSQAGLSYINSQPSSFQTFIGNKISHIQLLFLPTQ